MIPEYPDLPFSVVDKLDRMDVVQICHGDCCPLRHYHLIQTQEDLMLALTQLRMEGYDVPVNAC